MTDKHIHQAMSLKTSGELLDLSINIRRLREGRGWSQRELARRLGTKHPAVCRWETPVPTMTLASLKKLADVFNVRIADLFSSSTKDRWKR